MWNLIGKIFTINWYYYEDYFQESENGNHFEIIQHSSFAYIFVRVRKLDFDSLTETKNWGGRNEAIETSGRLRLLWPQNKRLHSPRTTDRLHTRQDRWIQKELALHLQRMPQNRIPLKSYLYSPQGNRTIGRPKKDGENNCNSGDGTGQMAQPWMFMMMLNLLHLLLHHKLIY